MKSRFRRLAVVALLPMLAATVGSSVGPEVSSALTVSNFALQFRGDLNQKATDVAVNATTGDTYVVGTSETTIRDAKYFSDTRANVSFAFLTRINAAGLVQWTIRLGIRERRTDGPSIDIDSSGQVYVFFSEFGSDSKWLSVIEKYNRDGTRVWGRSQGSRGNNVASSVTVSGSSVYTTYEYESDWSGAGGWDVAIDKRASATGDFQQSRAFGSTGNESALGGTTILSDGSIVIAGQTNGRLFNDARAATRVDNDFFVVNVSADLNDVRSRKQWGTTSHEYIADVTALRGGGFIAAGATYGALPGNSSHGGRDGVIVSLTNSLNVNWTAQVGSTADDEITTVVQSPVSTNVMFAGSTGGVLFGASAGNVDIIGGTFSTAGSLLHQKQFGTNGNDQGLGMDLRGDASPVIVGATTSNFDRGATLVSGLDAIVFSAGMDIGSITQYVGTITTPFIVKLPVIAAITSTATEASPAIPSAAIEGPGTPSLCNEVVAPKKVFRRDVATCAGLVVKQGTKTYIRLSKKNAAGVCSLSKKRRLLANAAGTCKVKIRATQRSGRTKAAWVTYTIS